MSDGGKVNEVMVMLRPTDAVSELNQRFRQYIELGHAIHRLYTPRSRSIEADDLSPGGVEAASDYLASYYAWLWISCVSVQMPCADYCGPLYK